MNLEEPINIYRHVSESLKGKNEGFYLFTFMSDFMLYSIICLSSCHH
jgi:hypothetical protein